jgi:hypothetical protein
MALFDVTLERRTSSSTDVDCISHNRPSLLCSRELEIGRRGGKGARGKMGRALVMLESVRTPIRGAGGVGRDGSGRGPESGGRAS